MAMKLAEVVIPVSDVDRAKESYSSLGWRLDVDRAVRNNFRLIQFAPLGSANCVQFAVNVTSAAAGSIQGLFLSNSVNLRAIAASGKATAWTNFTFTLPDHVACPA